MPNIQASSWDWDKKINRSSQIPNKFSIEWRNWKNNQLKKTKKNQANKALLFRSCE
jgi:hypothetical protein